jgi:hypothetical protein
VTRLRKMTCLVAAGVAALSLGCVMDANAPVDDPAPTGQTQQGLSPAGRTTTGVTKLGTAATTVDRVVVPTNGGLKLQLGGDDEDGPRPHPWQPGGNGGTDPVSDGNDEDGPRPHPWTPPADDGKGSGSGSSGNGSGK